MKHLSTIAGACIVIALLFASAAYSAVLVHSAAQLAKDKRVANLTPTFLATAAGAAAYEECTVPYGLKPEQVQFSKELFTQVSQQYLQAFEDSYMSIVGAASDEKIRTMYVTYVQNQQRGAASHTAELIKQKGCGNGQIRKILKYVEDVRYADAVKKAKEAQIEALKAAGAVQAPTDPLMTPITTTAPTAAPTQTPTTPTPGSN